MSCTDKFNKINEKCGGGMPTDAAIQPFEGIDYKSWKTAFQPWLDDDGSPILHSWGDVKTLDPRYVWSLTEEDDIESVAPGFHHINNLGFYVCDKPSGADTAPVQITEPEEYLDRVVSNVVYDAEMAISGEWNVDEGELEVMADNLRRAIEMNEGADSPRLKAAKILLKDVVTGLADEWDIHDSDGWQAMVDTAMAEPATVPEEDDDDDDDSCPACGGEMIIVSTWGGRSTARRCQRCGTQLDEE